MQICLPEILKTFAAAAVITVVGGIKVASETAADLGKSHGAWVQSIAMHLGINEFETLASQTSWLGWARAPIALAMVAADSPLFTPVLDPGVISNDVQLASVEPQVSSEIPNNESSSRTQAPTFACLTVQDADAHVDAGGEQVEFVAELLACATDASLAACEELDSGSTFGFDVNVELSHDRSRGAHSTTTFAWCPEEDSSEAAVRHVTFRRVTVCTASPANGQFAPLGRPLPIGQTRFQGMIRHDIPVPGRTLRVRSSSGNTVEASAREDLST
jgi:hypothetical protein